MGKEAISDPTTSNIMYASSSVMFSHPSMQIMCPIFLLSSAKVSILLSAPCRLSFLILLVLLLSFCCVVIFSFLRYIYCITISTSLLTVFQCAISFACSHSSSSELRTFCFTISSLYLSSLIWLFDYAKFFAFSNHILS